jgi:hypothetical protein
MAFRYSSSVLYGFVREPKRISPGKLIFNDIKALDLTVIGKEARIPLEYESGRVAILEWILKAARIDDPTTYKSSLLIDSQRIRGIDYFPTERKKFFKVHIPRGWHENVIDPNTGDDRHEPLDLGVVSDFEDFCRKVAKYWNIDYQTEGTLL